MNLLPKWLSLTLALGAVFMPLVSVSASLLKVEGSGGVPGFSGSELGRYLTLHMAEAQPANWRFEPAATGDTPVPDRVKWSFKLGPYAGGEVRSFVPRQMDDVTFGVHRPITIEARLYLNGKYQTLVKEKAIIQGGPDDPDLAAAVVNLTQNLLSPFGRLPFHPSRPAPRAAVEVARSAPQLSSRIRDQRFLLGSAQCNCFQYRSGPMGVAIPMFLPVAPICAGGRPAFAIPGAACPISPHGR
jgi:hypothetical protein